jgi:hypothetical protein
MLASPHDTLFKTLFSRPERAAEVLRHVLPADIARRIDWSTLTREPGSFIDETMHSSQADLLFSAALDGEVVRLYVLFEHQSTFDRWMPLRLLRYMVRIWEVVRKAEPDTPRLPVIFPVVMHHGEDVWSGSLQFSALFAAPDDAMPYVPQFRFLLDDLAAQDPEALLERAMSAFGRLGLAALQQARSPTALAELLRRWKDLIHEVLRGPHDHDALGAILRYLLEVRGVEEYPEAARVASAQFRSREAGMETIADWLRRTGRQEGRQEGQRDLLLRMLQVRFGEVPEASRRRVEAADEAELQAWVDRLFTAGSIAELLDG